MAEALPLGRVSRGRYAPLRAASYRVGRVARYLTRRPLAAISGGIIAGFVVLGLIAPWVASDPQVVNLLSTLTRPGVDGYVIGSDEQGRDIMSRMMWGARVPVIIGLAVAGVSTIFGTSIGLLSGYAGGKTDFLIQRVVDSFMAIPGLVLIIAMVSVFGISLWNLIFVLSLSSAPGKVRVVRGATMSIREMDFIHASRAVGCHDIRVMIRHIIPNLIGPIAVVFSITVGGAVLAEAGLSFLGLGVPPPTPTWGGMLSGPGRSYLQEAPWMAIAPGVAIAALVWGVNMMGDVLRDEIDPWTRRRGV